MADKLILVSDMTSDDIIKLVITLSIFKFYALASPSPNVIVVGVSTIENVFRFVDFYNRNFNNYYTKMGEFRSVLRKHEYVK